MAHVVAALITPFQDDRPDLPALSENLSRLGATPLTGALILGSSGEFAHLNLEERKAVLKAAKEGAPAHLTLFAQTGGGLSTKDSLALTDHALSLGYDACLAVTPYYYGRQLSSDEALKTLFKQLVALGPVFLYHIPGLTGVPLAPSTVASLRQLGIAGMKDSSGDMSFMSRTLAKVDPDFTYLVGAAGNLLPALAQGAKGGIMAAAQLAPLLLSKLVAAFEAGDLETARSLSRQVSPLDELTSPSRYGIAGLKYAAQGVGLLAGPPRQPLGSLSRQGRADIDACLDALSLRGTLS